MQATRDEAVAGAAGRWPEIMRRLRAAYPEVRCSLDFGTPFQLLIATILSAQCTDERVNQVTPGLFARYPAPEALAQASLEELEAVIRPTGFYHRKAEYIQAAAQRIAGEFGGEVPADMAALTTLPGVSRKTANVVLGNAYGMAEGIAVDTHVQRLSGRLGLSAETDPARIERDLMALADRADWTDVTHLLIYHGRAVCAARKPACDRCTLRDLCPSVRT